VTTLDESVGIQLWQCNTERGVDTSSVKRVNQPTRDVYVTRKLDGDRVFDSFGQDTNTYCDCFLQAEDLPEDKIRGADVLVLGSLGTAYPATSKALHKAVQIAKKAGTTVLVDLNWRPVFFNEPESALERILPVVQAADIVKLTNDEVEWAFGIPEKEALEQPERVWLCKQNCLRHS
jgi:fructokinase